MESQVEAQLERVVGTVRGILEDDIVGFYLYGSAVGRGLRPASDLDLLAITRRPTSHAERGMLVDGLGPISNRERRPSGWRPVELTLAVASEVTPWRYPPHVDFQYGEWRRDQFASRDFEAEPRSHADLAILLAQARQVALPLIGPPAEELIDPIPRGRPPAGHDRWHRRSHGRPWRRHGERVADPGAHLEHARDGSNSWPRTRPPTGRSIALHQTSGARSWTHAMPTSANGSPTGTQRTRRRGRSSPEREPSAHRDGPTEPRAQCCCPRSGSARAGHDRLAGCAFSDRQHLQRAELRRVPDLVEAVPVRLAAVGQAQLLHDSL